MAGAANHFVGLGCQGHRAVGRGKSHGTNTRDPKGKPLPVPPLQFGDRSHQPQNWLINVDPNSLQKRSDSTIDATSFPWCPMILRSTEVSGTTEAGKSPFRAWNPWTAVGESEVSGYPSDSVFQAASQQASRLRPRRLGADSGAMGFSAVTRTMVKSDPFCVC